MSPSAWTHLAYFAVSVPVTVSIGQTLYHHGRPFLLDVFRRDARTADAVNGLLLVGFYLCNVACVLYLVRYGSPVRNLLGGAHDLAWRVGVVLTALGLMHFANVAILLKVRQLWLGPRYLQETRAESPLSTDSK